tara:strand:- start:548 stop:1312 length:765 start_codon:yes stop_codon:yes gene_type:complete
MPIPYTLKPKYEYDLVRIGSKNDGGYLIEKNSLYQAEYLLSFGVSTDWNFEKEFIKKNSISFKCYDGSIDETYWFQWKKKSIKKALRFSFKEIYKYLKIKKSFHNFFNNDNFANFFIGKKKGNKNIYDVIDKIKKNKIFFKIDIEGSEYEILDQLIDIRERISGIAIEFHQCDQNIDLITNFINQINLPVVHLHANNYDPVSESGIPMTIEISLSCDPLIIGNKINLPHKFDMPNKVNKPEIKLEFLNEKDINY